MPQSEMQLDPEFYTPESDPRWLGLSQEEAQQAQEILESEIQQRSMQIDLLRLVIGVFEHPGWPHLEATLRRDLEQVRKAQGGATDSLVFRELRGKAEAFEVLLALPLKTRDNLRTLLDEVQELEEA